MSPSIIPLSDPIAAIWAEVPEVGCRGLCQRACGPIGMTAAEYDRLARAAGRRARTNDEGRCPYLTADGQCSGYRARPLVCRLWGAIDHPQMRCPHGCRPPQLLSDREGLALIARMKVAAESVRPGGGRHEFIQAPDTSDLQHLIGALSYLEQMKG